MCLTSAALLCLRRLGTLCNILVSYSDKPYPEVFSHAAHDVVRFVTQ
jgi:hypothetical protein